MALRRSNKIRKTGFGWGILILSLCVLAYLFNMHEDLLLVGALCVEVNVEAKLRYRELRRLFLISCSYACM